jgi:hypothetical protein
MSQHKQLQRAATKLYNAHSCTSSKHTYSNNPAPLLTFLLPRSQFSTSTRKSQSQSKTLNQVAKEVDILSHVFRIPGVGQSNPSSPSTKNPNEFLDTEPPARNSPPFLKIVMSPPDPASSPTPGTFRPESNAVKSLSGSTISSGEREIFAKIFDQMLTQSIPSSSKAAYVKGKKVDRPSEQVSEKSRRGQFLSAALLDDSLFLTPKEVAEYPPALRPLAARIGRRAEDTEIVKGHDWTELEKTLDHLDTDLSLLQFLDEEVFAVMEGQIQGLTKGGWSTESVRRNYSLILLKAMRLLRTSFGNPLAAHTLFLRAKTLSAESYVLGCSTQLYNELLLSRWHTFTDLYSITEILDEMTTNGLKGDGQTIQILQRIQDDVHEWATQGAEAFRAIWVAEKERMGKLERMQREIVGRIESDVEAEDMKADLEKEVKLLENKPEEFKSAVR